ncbi:MAG: hypothetical protein WCA32_01025 [Chromatiaceae bacterium]
MEDTLEELVAATEIPAAELDAILESMANKGLVMSAICKAVFGRGECLGAAERQPEIPEAENGNSYSLASDCFYGADARIRTADLLITNHALPPFFPSLPQT